MDEQIKLYLSDNFNGSLLFIGELIEKGNYVIFTAEILNSSIDIPKSCQVLKIDSSFGWATYLKLKIHKRQLMFYLDDGLTIADVMKSL